MDNLDYLFAAYMVIWAAVFGYVFFIHQKRRRLERRIGLLEEETDKQPMP
ncbi:MAG: CcmD family protein [Dehalococcoidia bacterium]